jgi:type I restriction enzyme S subunit
VTMLPEGWRWSTVDQVGRIQLGRQRAPRYHHGDNMKPYLRVANVFEDRIDASDLKYMHFEPAEYANYRLLLDDILLNEGQTPALLGRPALYRGIPGDVAFTNSLIRFQAGPDVDPRWALAVFRHHMHSGRFTRESRITTNIAHLSAARLKGVEFPVPPMPEQRRIVDLLEDHLSRLEAGLHQLRAAQRRNRSLRDAALRSELLGRRWPGDRLPCDMPAADVDDGVLSDLPAGWEWRRLQDVADVVGGVTKDASKQSDPAFVEVPYLRVANVQRGRLDLRTISRIRVPPAKLEQLRLEPGDVLLNEGGDRDKLGRGWVWGGEIEDCITQNHVFRARPRPGTLHPKLLSWAANSLGGPWCERNGKQSVNLASISLKRIRLMPLPVPPLDAQPELVLRLEDLHDRSARLDAVIDGQLARGAALRRSLLASAFSGRL